MLWLLSALCAATLINMSDAVSRDLVVSQKPRFYGISPGRFVTIYCVSSKQHLAAHVDWYKASEYDLAVSERQMLQGAITRHKDLTRNAFLILADLSVKDSGVYFCKINNTWGAGTQLQVARPVNRARAAHQSKMKDGLIIMQALMLSVFAAALLQRHRKLLKSGELIYEEPEIDHIYEGLVLEANEGDFYEELSLYAQVTEAAEAPWE
ncbi:B-cell antigen receptor complex-associated protein beta chain [Dunckerocampus dactyliophorus]|uniref:B-cell antigen receptor complex-associated protein beta chain n=1 Tax=Dunckerocampus dactyliophorus TaxID=161453 RepID=UPI0024067A18|nr:B-cell antigen receptor complex-associated protein beta chain [Dunckerocampus dactyliophorus]